MTNTLIAKTLESSEKWKTFFNQGSAAGCASMYEDDAVMVAKPFGTFSGRAQIQAFWQGLIDQGFAEVNYVAPNTQLVNENSTLLTSNWTMNNAQGVITRELWVLQDDDTMRLREDHFEALNP